MTDSRHWRPNGPHVYEDGPDGQVTTICRASSPEMAAYIAGLPSALATSEEVAESRAFGLRAALQQNMAIEGSALRDADLFARHLRQIAALERRSRRYGLALAMSLSLNLLALWCAYAAR